MKYPYVGPHVGDTIGGTYNKNAGARIVEDMCATYVSAAHDEAMLLGFATGIEAAACYLEHRADSWRAMSENVSGLLRMEAAHLRRQLTEMGR